MELSTEDKQRIEQEAQAHAVFADQQNGDYSFDDDAYIHYKEGYEAATIYEREQQAIPKPCHFCGGNGFIMGYENSSRGCKYCNGSGQITENIECLSLPECYAASKKLEQLEAERSEVAKENETLRSLNRKLLQDNERLKKEKDELRNKVIEEAIELLATNEYFRQNLFEVNLMKTLLNSLKK